MSEYCTNHLQDSQDSDANIVCMGTIGSDGKCVDCGVYYPDRDKSMQPMTIAEAEAALADVGNVLPMTDAEIDRAVDYVMTRIRANDN